MKRDGEGRNPEPLEAPEAPNPGGGPFPHYKRGGRRKQKDGGRSEGGRSHRRMDRPKRQMGGMMPAPQVPLAQMPPAQLSPAALAQLRAAGMGPRPGMPMGQKRGGRLSASERRAMPSGEFALPGHGEGPKGRGAGAYPIDTEGRARNALARGAQHASSAELATIKRKVHAKYPGIEIGGKE
jgi:hypothetical protein